jgi:putative transposase
MAQSLSNVLLHIVFSTKNRHPFIDVDIEEELFKYIAGICRNLKCPTHRIGGADDHVHIACSLSRTIAISKLVEEIKTGSSKWIKTKSDRYADFAWQNGYGAFSIGQSQLADLVRYIANQRQHHRRLTFQEEFRALLTKYQIEFDERYVWD